ncbi:MAG: amidohydrolase family protein [Ruminococcaceae bacterium]|nr:amidohydrolase family protein [Oscillospiraceae bacterium]
MYDVTFENGLVIDVRGKTSRIANVAVKNGVIAEISARELPAKRTIDASGLVVAPGFIDPHSHLDGMPYAGQLSALQGITTIVGGNCGLSPVDMAAFFDEQDKRGYVLNQLMCVGHSFSLRRHVSVTDHDAHAGAAQTDAMARLARKALDDGACGVSLGLDYAPGTSLAEIAAMAQAAAEYGRVLSVHTRLFTQNDLYSLYEMLAASKRANVRLLFSHFVYQYSGFGTMEPAIDVINTARESGLDVWTDTGMYTDWATGISTATFDEQTIKDNSLRFGDMVVATGKYTGQRLNRDLYMLLRKKYPDTSVICFTGWAEEIYAAMKQPYAMPSTDAAEYAKGEGHPQIAGSFPKYLREMVREQKLISLEEAVYKATLLPAEVFKIPQRGVLEEGYAADITVFDINTVAELAAMPDIGEPDAPPRGIPYVMVNGELAVDSGEYMHTLSGRTIRY